MGLGVCPSLFRTSANDSFGRIRFTRKKGVEFPEKTADQIPKTHLNKYVSAFRQFVEIAGAQYLSDSDLKILDVGSKDWERS